MKRAIAALLALTCLALAACGGDDDGPKETLGNITPVGTKQPTAQPSGGDGTDSGIPTPVIPGLDEELTLFLDDEVSADILPGESFDLDPEALAAAVGTPPSCDNFQFAFSWQVTDPYPPDGVVLSWQLDRDGSPVEVASGPAGIQSTGCGLLHASNGGATPITVAVHYLIGGR